MLAAELGSGHEAVAQQTPEQGLGICGVAAQFAGEIAQVGGEAGGDGCTVGRSGPHDIYAVDWRHPGDQVAYWRHKSRKCAEVLVPHAVEPQFLSGAYVIDDAASARLRAAGFHLQVVVDPVLFFRQASGA